MSGAVRVLLALLLVLKCTSVLTTHFRGAIIMLRPQPSDGEYTMEISYHISWRRDYGANHCDSATIASKTLLDGQGNLECFDGCSGPLTQMSYICTDYSVDENWLYGEHQLNYNFTIDAGQVLTIGFKGSDWIAPISANWRIPTTFSLVKRNDTGLINSTPRAITAPVIRLQEGCNHTIPLAVSDPDGDIIRCRWANGAVECGGICNKFPGAELNSDSCTINYAANRGAMYWAAALMVEDFVPNSTVPLSSVALQFLVLVVSSTEPCSHMPEFIPPTLRQGSCVAIPPGATFNTQLIATNGSSGAAIVEIETVSPSGTVKGGLSHAEGSNVYYVNITWTPEVTQQNTTHPFCFTAVSANGLSSTQTCIDFLVGHFPPLPIQEMARPNQELVHPSNTTWHISFDKAITRPSQVSYITFHELETEGVVYRIDASSSQEVKFEQPNSLSITPGFVFPEKSKLYINFARGVVQGLQGCGPGNEPVTGKDFWTFETMDVTPPTITFLENPSMTNANLSLSWKANENVTWQCILLKDTTELQVSCSGAHWRGYELAEGIYNLQVRATDEAGNMALAVHSFEVDLSPPIVSMVQKPALLSNEQSATFAFNCNEECSFECKFGLTGTTPGLSSSGCDSGVFATPALEHNNAYTFVVTATDQVGNRGETVSYTWETDFESPRVFGVQNLSVPCAETSPSHTGQPEVVDNRPEDTSLFYSDIHLGCSISRIWTGTDTAGNTAELVQEINLEYSPVVSLSPQVSLICDSTASSVHVTNTTAFAQNPCELPLQLEHEDSVSQQSCPSNFTRSWTVGVCGRNASVSQTIFLYDMCVPYACGRNESTPRGICLFGECQCTRPWYGTDCSSLTLQPKIDPIADVVLQEAQEYISSLNVFQGTPPLSWILLSGPNQLTLDQYTGQVSWTMVQAGNHTVSVQVENQVGEAQVEWNLQVVTGYEAFLLPVSSSIFPRGETVSLTGYVEYKQGNIIAELLSGIVPVNIDITSNGFTRTLKVITSTNGSFSTVFHPAATEYGAYVAGARHPLTSQAVPQVEWGFPGMKSTPRIVILNGETVGEIEKTFYNATVIQNDGPTTLHSLTATTTLSSDYLSVNFLLRGEVSNDTLEPGEKLVMDVKITASRPLSALFPVAIEATECSSLQLTVSLQIKSILPMLVVDPPSLNTRIVRGKSKVIEFRVTNIGKAVARNVQSIIPDTDYISFISFGSPQQNESELSVESGETAVLSILTQTPATQQLGKLSGKIIVKSGAVSESIPVALIVSSDLLMNLTVTVEDEYTYYTNTTPLVDNAAITLINYLRGIKITKTTEMDNGTVTFVGIHEDRYEMLVEAPGHRSVQQIVITSLDTPMVTVFLQRHAVTYTWSVTPTTFEDRYIISVEADFETRVPRPVVTVMPIEIDLNELELGYIDSFQLNITNHGLIRANEVAIRLPTGHPFLVFTTNTDDLGDLDALASITVAVHVSRKTIEKRDSDSCTIWAAYLLSITHVYVCGEQQLGQSVPVVLKKRGPSDTCEPGVTVYQDQSCNCNGNIRSSSGSSGGFDISDGSVTFGSGVAVIEANQNIIKAPRFSFEGFSSQTTNFCDKCIQSLLGCVSFPFPAAGCILQIASKTGLSSISDALSWLECAIDSQLWQSPPRSLKQFLKVFGKVSCVYDLYNECFSFEIALKPGERKRRSLRSTVNELIEAMYPIHLSIALGVEVLGDELWLSVEDPLWLSNILRPAMDDTSEAGVLISGTELSAILAAPPPKGTTLEMVKGMVERVNNTLYGWNNGQLEPGEDLNMASFSIVDDFIHDINSYNEKAKSKGFLSYLDAYTFAAGEANKIERWEDEAGVCAVVRIRIEQEIALTREAFLAKLEIENQEEFPLEQIELEILIVDPITGEEATRLFSIGNRTLLGSASSDGGKWSLPSEMSGSAEWLIVPYSEATSESDHEYDVGGTLSYVSDGVNIIIPLFPTTVTVRPNPLLLVHYFWEKYVLGDDPFTNETEPSVPFTLGIAVKNAGYGTASSLQITSGQPDIVENSKGLLVKLMIIGANVGRESTSPSLTVSFGDLSPNVTMVARWLMISSLQGEFMNYSATFENVNPLGDPKLSVLDELKIHELIRNVMMYNPSEDDGILDFLVNERKDLLAYPDALYSSRTLERHNVSVGEVFSVQEASTIPATVEVSTTTNSSGWVYYRYNDTQGVLSGTVSTGNATKSVGNTTTPVPLENTWISRGQLYPLKHGEKARYLHIIDYVETVGDVAYIINLCKSDCPAEEIPFERPTVVRASVSLSVIMATATTTSTNTVIPIPTLSGVAASMFPTATTYASEHSPTPVASSLPFTSTDNQEPSIAGTTPNNLATAFLPASSFAGSSSQTPNTDVSTLPSAQALPLTTARPTALVAATGATISTDTLAGNPSVAGTSTLPSAQALPTSPMVATVSTKTLAGRSSPIATPPTDTGLPFSDTKEASADENKEYTFVVIAVAVVGGLSLIVGTVIALSLCYFGCMRPHRVKATGSFQLTPL